MLGYKTNGLESWVQKIRGVEFPAFANLISDYIPAETSLQFGKQRKRVFSTWVTLILLVYQVLIRNMSCDEIPGIMLTCIENAGQRNSKLNPGTPYRLI